MPNKRKKKKEGKTKGRKVRGSTETKSDDENVQKWKKQSLETN